MFAEENDINISSIDRLHDDMYKKLNSDTVDRIYRMIRSHPLQYLLANGYFRRFMLFTVTPFF